MAFLERPSSQHAYSDALATWRSSSLRVRDRWHEFRISQPEARPFMFAAYVAALDCEEAAAAELALLVHERAA